MCQRVAEDIVEFVCGELRSLAHGPVLIVVHRHAIPRKEFQHAIREGSTVATALLVGLGIEVLDRGRSRNCEQRHNSGRSAEVVVRPVGAWISRAQQVVRLLQMALCCHRYGCVDLGIGKVQSNVSHLCPTEATISGTDRDLRPSCGTAASGSATGSPSRSRVPKHGGGGCIRRPPFNPLASWTPPP